MTTTATSDRASSPVRLFQIWLISLIVILIEGHLDVQDIGKDGAAALDPVPDKHHRGLQVSIILTNVFSFENVFLRNHSPALATTSRLLSSAVVFRSDFILALI